MTESEREKAKSLYESGLSCLKIGKILGIHHTLVRYHLLKIGVVFRNKRIDWPIEEMRRLYEVEGWTLQQIADHIGQKQKAVNKVAKKNGFQMRRTGPKGGAGHPEWKGGRRIDKAGYILVYCPDHPYARNNCVREHRLVAEKALGRYLLPTEVVHHVNDDPADNRLENLVVYETNGKHLAETLAGKCPQWTEDVKRRSLEGVRRSSQRKSSRDQSKRDAQECKSDDSHPIDQHDKDRQLPSEMESQPDQSPAGQSSD